MVNSNVFLQQHFPILVKKVRQLKIYFLRSFKNFSLLANGAQSINTNAFFPDKFCERGGQIIFIQLEEELVKKDGM